MSPFFIYLIFGLYILILLYLGYKGAQKTIDVVDYFIASQNMNPYVMSLSYVASFVSSSAIIGFAGVAAVYGFPLFYLVALNVLLGIFVAFVFFGKRIRSLSVLLEARTIPELIGKRFQSPFLQKLTALILVLAIPLYTGVITIGAAYIVKEFFGIDVAASVFIITILIALFIVAGGIRSVMYTDTFQAIIIFIGMALFGVLLLKMISQFGGWQKIISFLSGIEKYVPQKLYDEGFRGWLKFPLPQSNRWWVLVSSLISGVGIGVLAQPHLLVRFMTIKSNREINRGIIIGSIFMFVVVSTALISGILSNVFIFQKTGQVAFLALNQNVDLIIPYFVKNFLYKWFQPIFLLTVLAAAISTLTSLYHIFGTVVVNDLFSAYRHNLTVTKAAVALSIFITMIIAFMLPPNIIAIGTALYFSIIASIFLPLILFAIFVKEITKAAAEIGTVIVTLLTLVDTLFVHKIDAMNIGLSSFFFQKNHLFPDSPLQSIDIIFIALPVAVFLFVIISAFTKPYPYEALAYWFEGMKVERDKFILEKKAKLFLKTIAENVDKISTDIEKLSENIEDTGHNDNIS